MLSLRFYTGWAKTPNNRMPRMYQNNIKSQRSSQAAKLMENEYLQSETLGFYVVFQDGVRPGLAISAAGLARQSLDFRLVRDL